MKGGGITWTCATVWTRKLFLLPLLPFMTSGKSTMTDAANITARVNAILTANDPPFDPRRLPSNHKF